MQVLPILASHGFPWAELVVSAVGGLIGGLTGGLFAVRAQDKAIRAQREAQRDAEVQEVNGILKLIEEELLVIQHWLIASLEQIFKERDKSGHSQLPLSAPCVYQNPFTIYDSNASTLGRVTDPDLRQLIVRTYTRAKTLVDMLNQNNQKYQIWNGLRHGIGAEPTRAQQMHGELLEWASEIRRLQADIQPFLSELLKRLKEVESK